MAGVDKTDIIRHIRAMPVTKVSKKKDEAMQSPEELEERGTLGVSARHIRRLCESGELKGIDVGTGTRHWWKIPDSAVRDFMRRRGMTRA